MPRDYYYRFDNIISKYCNLQHTQCPATALHILWRECYQLSMFINITGKALLRERLPFGPVMMMVISSPTTPSAGEMILIFMQIPPEPRQSMLRIWAVPDRSGPSFKSIYHI